MYDWLTFIIAALAVYRVARMITEEDGPAFIFKRFRDTHDDSKSSFDVGIRCFYCVSLWAALVASVWLVAFAHWELWLLPIFWFGIAGAAAKIYEYWKR